MKYSSKFYSRINYIFKLKKIKFLYLTKMQQQQTSTSTQSNQANFDKKTFNQNEKPKDVRKANILAAKGMFFIFKLFL
jgi:hypothetical protein